MGTYGPLRTQRGVSGRVQSGYISQALMSSMNRYVSVSNSSPMVDGAGAKFDGTKGIYLIPMRTLQDLGFQLSSDGTPSGSPIFRHMFPASGTNDYGDANPWVTNVFQDDRNVYRIRPSVVRFGLANHGGSRAKVTIRVHRCKSFHETFADPLSIGWAGIPERYAQSIYTGAGGYVAPPSSMSVPPNTVDSPVLSSLNYTSGEGFGRFWATTYTKTVVLGGGGERSVSIPIPGCSFRPDIKFKEAVARPNWFAQETESVPGVTLYITITCESLGPGILLDDGGEDTATSFTYAPCAVAFIGQHWQNIYRYPSKMSPPIAVSSVVMPTNRNNDMYKLNAPGGGGIKTPFVSTPAVLAYTNVGGVGGAAIGDRMLGSSSSS